MGVFITLTPCVPMYGGDTIGRERHLPSCEQHSKKYETSTYLIKKQVSYAKNWR